MLKRIALVLIVVAMVTFTTSRIDSAKSISSEYMLLSVIEEQNMHQILRTIKYNVSSFSLEGYFINTTPKEGVVTLDTATDDMIHLKNESLAFTNNYMFPMGINYNNMEKSVEIRSSANISTDLVFGKFNIVKDGITSEVNIIYSPN